MIRDRIVLICSLFCFFQVLTAPPALADDKSTCAQSGGGDNRIAACSKLIARSNGRDAWAFDTRGVEYGERGDTDRAIADFSEAIRINPKFDNAYRHRGFALTKKSEYERAIADFTEAIRLNPKHVDAYNDRGLSYVATGDSDRALNDYNEAIRVNPRFKYAYYNRGRLYNTRGDADRAIAEFSEAIRIDPEYAMAYLNRGLVFQQKGDLDRAMTDYNDVVRINPQIVYSYNNRGNVYRQRGQCDRAIADYNEALRIDPAYPSALTNRGFCYEKMGETAKARADFAMVVSLPQKYDNGKWALDKARERLAVLPSAPAATASPSTNATTVVATTSRTDDRPALARDDRRVALVIGNSAYANVPALANPVRDATLVAETLKRTGFDSVMLVTDLSKDALVQALRKFATQAESADWAVIYYAGHGMEIGGTNYLIPIDAKVASDRDIGFEAVPLDQLVNVAERARRLRLVILDACRDNPFAGQMKRTVAGASRSVSRGLAAVEPDAGTLVVYAAKDGETALDGEGTNSPFANAFASNVLKPGVEVRRLFDYVRDDVMDATSRRQKPFSYGSISGRQDFFFIAGK